jgi:hypothetical protein
MSIFIFFIIVVAGIILFAFTSKSTKADNKRPSQQTVQKQSQSVRLKIIIESETSNAPVQELKYFCIKDKGYHVTVWPKDYNHYDMVRFNIAGVEYRDNIDGHLGEFVGVLDAEPTNPYDKNAIKVLAGDGHHVGYLPKDMTAEVRKAVTLPCPCFCYIGKRNGIYFSCCYIPLKN